MIACEHAGRKVRITAAKSQDGVVVFEDGRGRSQAVTIKGFGKTEVGLAFIPASHRWIPLSKKKLSEGEHRSPPEGYPKDKDSYAVPKYYLFPIDDEEHTRAAIGYFSKHDWKPDEHKEEAAKRILRAAKKFGIKVSDDSDVARAAHGG